MSDGIMHKKCVKKMTFVDTITNGQYNEFTKWYYQLRTFENEVLLILPFAIPVFFTPKIGTTTWK